MLDTADITIIGKLLYEGDRWFIVAGESNQRFLLEGKALEKLPEKLEANSDVEITGTWKTADEGAASIEVVEPQTVKKTENAQKTTANFSPVFRGIKFINADFVQPAAPFFPGKAANNAVKKPLAPIRTTSPGLTVFQGGAVTPRLYFIRQHLGDLDVNRQVLDISVSYTPTPKLQLEAEIPVSRTSFDDGTRSGSDTGLGNITLWSKYRFFRTVKTYGDRQAAFRFGIELPTGKKTAPNANQINASPFVRQQLTPISGGLSPHFDIAFSQAGGRFIFGGNIEGILRTERDGFRMGHELRVNTDLEYVLLPIKYQKPGKELFLILESSFVVRGNGRIDSAKVPGSSSTEYYLSPGLQYAAAPQFVIEGSIQLPVFRNAGPEVLRTDYNLLLGVKYLF